MSEFDKLVQSVTEKFPQFNPVADPAFTNTGTSFIDCSYRGHRFVIEHRAGYPLGLSSSPEVAYGDAYPEESYETADALLDRLSRLLKMVDALERLDHPEVEAAL